ncbi:hypothetical protein GCM10009839_76770 [Catenulispora yoronensis]|uniref:DUF2142 domain-containing protein n=1 Tax=Catenulispora yoronensis TaxID=450799 RepID=A0ABN2V9Q1_9ACTN
MSRTPRVRISERLAWSRRVWLLAFAAFGLLAAAWSLAMPVDGTTDERQHLERAYGAVSGHLLGPQGVDPLVHRPGAAFQVPKSLLPPNALCVYFPNYRQDRSWVANPASCQRPAPATHAKVRVVSWVGRYNPLYYLAVGAPLRFSPDLTGIILSRLLAATLSAAFAATAAAIAVRTRRPLLLAAILTVMTPTTVALSSTVNPNGVEITAATLLWVCLVDLARPRLSGATNQRLLLGLAAVAGAVVLTVRAMGPFWFALAVAGAAAIAEPGRLRELLRRPAARLTAGAWVVVGALAVAWNVVSGNNKVTHTLIAVHPADRSVVTLLRVIAVERVGGWFTEAFALDIQASWVPLLWAALSAAVLIPLALLRARRVVLTALAVAAVSLGITVVLEIRFLGTLGWSQYGRYFLPGLAGVAVLLAAPFDDLPAALARRLPRLFALGAAAAQLWVLMVEMTRVQSGPVAPLNPLAGSWHPAVGSPAVLLVAALGAAALIALVWTATPAQASLPSPAGPYHGAKPQPGVEAGNTPLRHLMA